MKKKSIQLFLGVLLMVVVSIGAYFYQKIFRSSFHGLAHEKVYLYIPTHSSFRDLESNLSALGILRDTVEFRWVANYFKFGKIIKPGKYELENGMTFRKLFRKITLGDQIPVNLILHNLRLRENLASFVSHHLEADSASIMENFNRKQFADSLGFDLETLYTLILPNSYSFKWNTSATQFFSRMVFEYHKYWNPLRMQQASAHGLSPIKVLILASIVTQESNKPEDMRLIAGVYLNRLKANMRLQADPTVVFANQDFSIRRVTAKYLEKDSPYNTYRYFGLPPGPITMPTEQGIEAVLTSPPTEYLYFCAKDDFSGNHAFAKTKEEHIINAKKFHEALNARNIH